MQKLFFDYRVAAVVAGLLTEWATLYFQFLPAWFCFVPLFVILQTQAPRIGFKAGLIFGLVIALISFYWMMPGAQRFTGSSMLFGVIVYVMSTALLSLYFGGINYLFCIVKLPQHTWRSGMLNGLLIAAIYVLGEAALTLISTGMPWFGFHSGYGLLNNLYAIQPAAAISMHGLSFVVVFINYLVAYSVVHKKWTQLYVPALLLLAYLAAGYGMYKQFDRRQQNNSSFSLAILSANIAPEVRWNEHTGNALVQKILGLNQVAASLSPNVILWSESAVPWTYQPNDDLVNELLKTTANKNITHLLGINTSYRDNEVYNSVYSLQPNGEVAGRYDKRYLLSFLEEGTLGMVIPFFSTAGFMVKEGTSHHPVSTPYGKAGVMICNESTIPHSAISMVKNGAQFLVNLSNDGWFEDTYIPNVHFYVVRLRAVETRKDVAVNSNYGFSGLVKANGEIVMKENSRESFVKKVTVTPNHYISGSVRMPAVFIYISGGCLLAGIILFILRKQNGIGVQSTKP